MKQATHSPIDQTDSALVQAFRRIVLNEHLLISVFLLGVLCFFYHDVIFSGHTFLVEDSINGQPNMGPYGYSGSLLRYGWDPGAISHQMQPWDRFFSLTYKAGQIPLWNPHQGLGIPQYADGNSGIFDPIHALIYLVPINWWSAATDFHLLARYFLAGLFTYWVVRSLGVKRLGAMAASVCYMFSSYLVQFGNISFMRLDTLLPLVLFAYYRLATKRSLSAFLLVVIAVFLLVVGDFPEVLVVHVGFGLWWYAYHCALKANPSSNGGRMVFTSMAQGVIATLAGLLLGAFILLPFAQFLSLANHAHTPEMFTKLQLEAPWPLEKLADFLVLAPGVTRLGVVSIVCAIFGLWAGRQARKLGPIYERLALHSAFFAGTILLIILISFRVFIFKWIAELPLINMIFLNRCTQPALIFCMACLTAIGLEFLFSPEIKGRFKFNFLFSALVFGLVLFASTLASTTADNPLFLGFKVIFLIICLVLLFFLNGTVAMAVRNATGATIAGVLIIGLMVLEPAILQPTGHELRYDPFTEPPFVTYIRNQPGPFRIVATDGILIPNMSSAFGIDDLRFEDALSPKNLFDLYLHSLASTDEPGFESLTRFDGRSATPIFGRAMDVLNVQYVLTPNATPPPSADGDTSRFEPVHQSDHVYIYRNKNVYPRAWVVNNAEVIADEQKTFDRLLAKDFDPRNSVILSEPLPQDIQQMLAPAASASDQKDPVVTDRGNSTTIRVDMAKPGLLVLSNLYYPGWEATVDGKPVHTYEAYKLIRAIYLGAGSHSVEFTFRPPLFFAGLAIAFLVVLVLIIGGVVRLAQLRRHRSRPANPSMVQA